MCGSNASHDRWNNLPDLVCAPMAGGPSTVDLAVAVSDAGGLGFLAAGYLTADTLGAQVSELRARTDQPFGVNLFLVPETAIDGDTLDAYLAELQPDADRLGVALGEPRFDDDALDAKLAVLLSAGVPVVSCTFGCPEAALVRALQAGGTKVWVTVATGADAQLAAASGCDALVVQGREAGGHRAAFQDDGGVDALDTLDLVREVAAYTELPLVAAGGIADAAAVRAARAAGARAVQAGTAFLLTPEAGTHAVLRAAVKTTTATTFTRAFSGRTARGIVNGFVERHPDAPFAYPQVHHATTPLRAASRAADDPDSVNLWAGTRHAEARAVPAAEVVRALAAR
ncbi:MAG: 2-nitropropane dioxygenase [Thermoleophilia bacterium]|nr:2-nitropropane dioxygenase [Thermoleophilia bacterium]